MKRIYLTILALIAASAVTQVQAFQEKHLYPSNWSCETVKGYVGKAASYFGYHTNDTGIDPVQRDHAKVRRQYYVNKIAEDKKMRENEKANLVNTSRFMNKSAPLKIEGIAALIAETCGSPDMPQSMCDKATTDLQNAARDIARYADDRKEAVKAIAASNKNIEKYEKKIKEFDTIIDAYDAQVKANAKPSAWVSSLERKFATFKQGVSSASSSPNMPNFKLPSLNLPTYKSVSGVPPHEWSAAAVNNPAKQQASTSWLSSLFTQKPAAPAQDKSPWLLGFKKNTAESSSFASSYFARKTGLTSQELSKATVSAQDVKHIAANAIAGAAMGAGLIAASL